MHRHGDRDNGSERRDTAQSKQLTAIKDEICALAPVVFPDGAGIVEHEPVLSPASSPASARQSELPRQTNKSGGAPAARLHLAICGDRGAPLRTLGQRLGDAGSALLISRPWKPFG
jgi:hypothetical protein